MKKHIIIIGAVILMAGCSKPENPPKSALAQLLGLGVEHPPVAYEPDWIEFHCAGRTYWLSYRNGKGNVIIRQFAADDKDAAYKAFRSRLIFNAQHYKRPKYNGWENKTTIFNTGSDKLGGLCDVDMRGMIGGKIEMIYEGGKEIIYYKNHQDAQAYINGCLIAAGIDAEED